jgi:hypothetical protein
MIRNCVVCSKKIQIKRYKSGSNGNIKHIYYSDDGILFLRKWFCNDCWNEIRSIK